MPEPLQQQHTYLIQLSAITTSYEPILMLFIIVKYRSNLKRFIIIERLISELLITVEIITY